MASERDPELVASLERHNATFTKLLSLIPSRFYAAPDPDEVSVLKILAAALLRTKLTYIQLDSRWMKKKKRQTGEEIKEQKKKAKLDKVDLSLLKVYLRDWLNSWCSSTHLDPQRQQT